MALYLGTQKVSLMSYANLSSGHSNYITGTAMSNDDGVVTFSELPFIPKIIAIWNIVEKDLKAEAEQEGQEWEEGYVQYIYEGIMLFAIYQDGTWVSQGMGHGSGEAYISNASVSYGSCVTSDGNTYYYRISRDENDGHKYGNTTFNYTICG